MADLPRKPNSDPMDEAALRDLQRIFTYRAPKEGQPERYGHIRSTAGEFAADIIAMCPQGIERTTALQKLQEVVMWANAAIARNE